MRALSAAGVLAPRGCAAAASISGVSNRSNEKVVVFAGDHDLSREEQRPRLPRASTSLMLMSIKQHRCRKG